MISPRNDHFGVRINEIHPDLRTLSTWHGAYIFLEIKGLFRYTQKPKTLQDFPSHRILQHLHGTLNIDKKDN